MAGTLNFIFQDKERRIVDISLKKNDRLCENHLALPITKQIKS